MSEGTSGGTKSAVVTGASSGIGWGTTRVLTSRGFHVFAGVRRERDAERLRAEFGSRVTPLLFDVTHEAAVGRAAERVGEALGNRALGGLVNNAGVAVPGPLMHQPVAEFRRQLEVNLVSALVVTQAFLGLLGAGARREGGPGRVVNVSSTGGRMAPPFLGAYAASKHGLEGFSESLRRELMLYGVDVIVVGPGAVATSIWDKAEAFDATPFDATGYRAALAGFRAYMVEDGRRGLAPERVGEVVHTALTVPRPRVRYAVVRRPLAEWTLPMSLPRRAVDRLIARRLGFARG